MLNLTKVMYFESKYRTKAGILLIVVNYQ